MAYTLPPLPYDYSALEPHIDARTMEIHHTKHHQTYVNNLNAAIEKAPELNGRPLDELLLGISRVPEAVRTAMRTASGTRPMPSSSSSRARPLSSGAFSIAAFRLLTYV